jgi:hypothetical protein
MKKIIKMVTVSILLFCVNICYADTPADKRKMVIQNAWEWLNYKSIKSYDDFSNEIVYTILEDDYLVEGIDLLSNQSFYIVTGEVYEYITGRAMKRKYAIIVRAVYGNLGASFEVLQDSASDILVSYAILGSKQTLHKAVLLIEVDNLPNNVYVSCIGAA